MKDKLRIIALLMVLFSSAHIASAGQLVVGTSALQDKGFVTVPLSITGNTHAIGSVSVTITYDGSLLALSSEDVFLAGDAVAAAWQLHAAPTPPLQTNIKGVQLHLYKIDGSAVLSGEVIHLADIQLNVLNTDHNIPLKVSSFTVRDQAGVAIKEYTAINGNIKVN